MEFRVVRTISRPWTSLLVKSIAASVTSTPLSVALFNDQGAGASTAIAAWPKLRDTSKLQSSFTREGGSPAPIAGPVTKSIDRGVIRTRATGGGGSVLSRVM